MLLLFHKSLNVDYSITQYSVRPQDELLEVKWQPQFKTAVSQHSYYVSHTPKENGDADKKLPDYFRFLFFFF